MRLLALSDITCWTGLEALVADIDPEAVLLGGDLVHDGNLDTLAYHRRPAKARKLHVKAFYAFLEDVGPDRPILIVRGNHDTEALGFHRKHVARTAGVELIGGRVRELGDIRIAGVDHMGPGRKAAIKKARKKADLVLSHAPVKLMPRLAGTHPAIVVQGHNGVGQFERDGTHYVLTCRAHYAIVHRETERRWVTHLHGPDGAPIQRHEAKAKAGLTAIA